MKQVLLSWIGKTHDLSAPTTPTLRGGPILTALRAHSFDHIVLLNDHGADAIKPYLAWLRAQLGVTTPITVENVVLPNAMAFGEIYGAAVRVCAGVRERLSPDAALTFFLSPGSPAMAAVWMLLAKTRFPARLIQGIQDGRIEEAVVPFDIWAELVPTLLKTPDSRLSDVSQAGPVMPAAFLAIKHRSPKMRHAVTVGHLAAIRSVPVLVLGESGTGKEVFARAVHSASPRRDQPFVAVNCGAIPSNLVESELFGHDKGAFTGASRSRRGRFAVADRGTLFLDELGDLPLDVQVKLLRVLQEGEFEPVGSEKTQRVDVRVIAATNRDLGALVRAGRFRADLYYRLGVAILELPPLRERREDFDDLVDQLIADVNRRCKNDPGFTAKEVSAPAKKSLARQPWPGNVRELFNVLLRAAMWSAGTVLRAEDVQAALLSPVEHRDAILDRPLSDGFSLESTLSEVERHFVVKALDEAAGNKTKAAKLLGLDGKDPRKAVDYLLEKYGLKAPPK